MQINISNIHANHVHKRTRATTYTQPQRAIAVVKITNFVRKRKPVFVIWNRAKRTSLKTRTIGNVKYHQINIGAGMFHWVAA